MLSSVHCNQTKAGTTRTVCAFSRTVQSGYPVWRRPSTCYETNAAWQDDKLTYEVVFDLTRRTSHEVWSPFFIIVSNISVHDKLKELVKPDKQKQLIYSHMQIYQSNKRRISVADLISNKRLFRSYIRFR